ncbi:MAG: hypothetical protein PF693_06215 [Spirochaetia bacterium]|jgi:hypothetical protein|nr:hypothetical protein [Spirochaetia bacterium]
MKKTLIIYIIIFCSVSVFSEDQNKAFKVGLQADSDTYMGLIVKAGPFEIGLKAQWSYIDAGDLQANGIVSGAHLSYLFQGKDGKSSLGAGVDFRTLFGESDGLEYSEYVDAFYAYKL